MNDDDFLLDDDDLENQDYITPIDDDGDEDDGGEDSDEDAVEDSGPPRAEQDYGGKMTRDEIFLSSYYDDIYLSAKKNQDRISMGGGRSFDGNIVDAVRIIIGAAPKNTSVMTVENFTKEFFQTQSHNRIPASVYVPDQPIRNSDLDEEFGGSDDGGFNSEYIKEYKNLVSRFIKYLSDRDLSRDSISSLRRKQRQLPAFIIFLFSAGLYDLILNCETMPEEYEIQIKNAFKKIQKRKYDVVEQLAQRYEERGRTKVAERVRKMGISWFDKEPAEIKSRVSYADLELTPQDIIDYKEFRPRFTNASKSITQDFISDYIEVVIEPGKIYEKLKDKTKSDAIADVKKVFRDWAKENAENSELADKIIWKDLKR